MGGGASNRAQPERAEGRRPGAGAAPGAEAASGALALPGVPAVPGPVDGGVGQVLTDSLQRQSLPVALLCVVVAFLLVQSRMDRRDPKLTSAPVAAGPDPEFGPVLGVEDEPG